MLLTWDFTPKVLGYIPKVRGVVTGLADQAPSPYAAGDRVRRHSERPLVACGPAWRDGQRRGRLPVLRLVGVEIASSRQAPAAASPT